MIKRKWIIVTFLVYPVAMFLLFAVIQWFQYEPMSHISDTRLEQAMEAPIYVYGIAFICSSVALWSVVFAVMLGAWCIAFYRRSILSYVLANFGSFSFYCLPIILLFTGVIKYCGE